VVRTIGGNDKNLVLQLTSGKVINFSESGEIVKVEYSNAMIRVTYANGVKKFLDFF